MIFEKDFEIIDAYLKSSLSEKRYRHILAVKDMSVRIAKALNFSENDIKRIALCALCHDISRELSVEKHIEILKSNGVPYDDRGESNKALMHAKTGAILAKNKYPNIFDKEMCDAISYHTTARENMTLFDKILFLADYIDDSRKYDDCIKMRELFWSEFEKSDKNIKTVEGIVDKVIIECLKNTIVFLTKLSYYIDIETVKAYNYLVLCEKNTENKGENK